jgi:hypothetical protein
MSAHADAGASRSSLPALTLVRAGLVTVIALFVLAIGAIGGGLALVVRPDGSLMQWERSMLAGSPFADFLLPGLILLGLFGVGALIVAIAGIRRAPWAPFAAFAIGCAQMIWILVELAIIGEFSFLHPTMFGIGALIAAASVRWGWPIWTALRDR